MVGKSPTAERIKQFFSELGERLPVPALGSVTLASDIPIQTLTNSQRQLEIRGRETPSPPPITAYLYRSAVYREMARRHDAIPPVDDRTSVR